MRTAIVAALVLSLAGCSRSGLAESVSAADMAAILTSPSAFDGRLIRVEGAAVVGFEASFLCPTARTLNAPGGPRNCLSLVPGESDGEAYDLGQLDGKTVEIVGRFNSKSFEHMGAYGGTLAITSGRIKGSHNMGRASLPPPLPGTSANTSRKPKPPGGATQLRSQATQHAHLSPRIFLRPR